MFERIMHNVFRNTDSCLYWCLAYICEGIFDLHIYVAVTSPHPRDRGVTLSISWTLSWTRWLQLRNRSTAPTARRRRPNKDKLSNQFKSGCSAL